MAANKRHNGVEIFTSGRQLYKTRSAFKFEFLEQRRLLAALSSSPTQTLDLAFESSDISSALSRNTARPVQSELLVAQTSASATVPDRIGVMPLPSLPIPENATSIDSAEAPPFPIADTFLLHSLPGATKRIYLDFNGHTTTGTVWNTNFTNGTPIVTPAYSEDFSNTFSDNELATIQEIFQRVSEDFIGFNVDVTTQDPGTAALMKSDSSDVQWGIRVVIGGSSSDWYGSAGGVAYINSFNYSTDTPAFVFADNLSAIPGKYVAEATSHEIGHTLGLNHDGRVSPTETYYRGHGSGETAWAPIMGSTYYNNLTQWSKGEYLHANNKEDDLTIITTQNGFGYRPDDYGNPTPLVFSGSEANVSGILEKNDDIDTFTFTTSGGHFFFEANPFSVGVNNEGANNDMGVLVLKQAPGSVAEHIGSTDTLDARGALDLSSGTYSVLVYSTYKGTPLTDGYSDYGSMGRYSLRVSRDVGDTIATAFDTGLGAAAGTVRVGDFIGNGIYTMKEVDIYSFQAAAGSEISLRTSQQSGSPTVDTYLRLFNAAGVQLTSDDDSAGSGYSAITNFRLPNTGTYFVGVTDWRNILYNPTVIGSGNTGNTGKYYLDLTLAILPEIDVRGNGISIADGDTTPSSVDGTAFGQQNVTNGSITQAFTIVNTSAATLDLTGSPRVQVTGAHAADFSVSVQPSSTVAPGGVTTFEVIFDPSFGGIRTAMLSIANNDSDEAPYNFQIQGTSLDVGNTIVTAQNTGLGIAGGTVQVREFIGNGVFASKDVDIYSFQAVAGSKITLRTSKPGDSPSMDTYLRLFNAAGNQLAANDNGGGSGYSLINNFTLANSGLYYVGVTGKGNSTYNPKVAGSGKVGTFGTYSLALTLAAPLAPEIDVRGNSVSIVDGDTTPSTTDHTSFGSQNIASGTVTRTFTIANTGTATLILNGNPKVQVSGANASNFRVSVQPAGTVVAGGSVTFQVVFNPSAVGIRKAILTIPNNDSNEKPYDFVVQGNGTSAAAPVSVAEVKASNQITNAPLDLEPAEINDIDVVGVVSVLDAVWTNNTMGLVGVKDESALNGMYNTDAREEGKTAELLVINRPNRKIRATANAEAIDLALMGIDDEQEKQTLTINEIDLGPVSTT